MSRCVCGMYGTANEHLNYTCTLLVNSFTNKSSSVCFPSRHISAVTVSGYASVKMLLIKIACDINKRSTWMKKRPWAAASDVQHNTSSCYHSWRYCTHELGLHHGLGTMRPGVRAGRVLLSRTRGTAGSLTYGSPFSSRGLGSVCLHGDGLP